MQEIVVSVAFLALAAALAFVSVVIARSYVMLSKRHQQAQHDSAAFAISMARLTLSEWMKIGVKTSVPEVDREVESIQQEYGVTRERAVEMYADRLGAGVNGSIRSN